MKALFTAAALGLAALSQAGAAERMTDAQLDRVTGGLLTFGPLPLTPREFGPLPLTPRPFGPLPLTPREFGPLPLTPAAPQVP